MILIALCSILILICLFLFFRAYNKKREEKKKLIARQEQLNVLKSIIGKEATYEYDIHINTDKGCIRSTRKQKIFISKFDNRFVYYTDQNKEEHFERIDWFLRNLQDGEIQIIKGKD